MPSNLVPLHELLSIPNRDKLCLIDGTKTLNYGELDEQSSSFSENLNSLGIKNGDRVALLLPNCWQYVVAMFGVLKLGAICVPIDYRSSEREIQFFIENSEAALTVVSASREIMVKGKKISIDPDSIRPISMINASFKKNINLDDPALLLYTGGTTGFPKGVVLSNRNIISVLSGLSHAWGLREGKEVFAQFLPMSHSGGLNCNLNSAIFNSGSTVIMRKFDPVNLLELVEKHGITCFAGVPTIYNALIHVAEIEKRKLSTLRICFSSGATLSVETAEEFKRKVGLVINVGWGLTEAAPQLAVAPLGVFKQNYAGMPIEGTEIAAFDESGKRLPLGAIGELGARGPQVMSGYWQNEKETREVLSPEGWLLTGDTGYVGSDGVYLLGRKKETINSGGYKIWPNEVEGVLMENEHVLEVAVTGVPDQLFGEKVKAFVVAKSPVTEEELKAFCRSRLSSYKVPKSIEFRTFLPRSSVGKILRRALSEEKPVSPG